MCVSARWPSVRGTQLIVALCSAITRAHTSVRPSRMQQQPSHRNPSDVRPWNTPSGSVVRLFLLRPLRRHMQAQTGAIHMYVCVFDDCTYVCINVCMYGYIYLKNQGVAVMQHHLSSPTFDWKCNDTPLHQQTFIITCWLDQHMLTRMHTHTCTPMRMQTYIRKQIHALEAYRRTCVFVTHLEMGVLMKPTYTRAHVSYQTPTDTHTYKHACMHTYKNGINATINKLAVAYI